MYISCLLINVGDNPDRPRPGRLWLRNLYHVHQRLCMAFPSDLRKQRDPDFLAPYTPDDFPEQRHLADKKKTEVDPDILKHVHSPRTPDSGFLFCIDPQPGARCGPILDVAPPFRAAGAGLKPGATLTVPGGRAVILVQSAVKPDWEYAFHNACYLLAAPPEVKPFDPCFTGGQRLRFRLVANPTRRLSKHSRERDGKPVEEKWIGKRVPVPADQLLDWLADWRVHRDEPPGFSIDKGSTTVQAGYIY
ncbi:MAG: type I-E CRISPR-associated protein Cas6/Cse3/CasE, partial [Terriglobia bacterium]